MEDGTIEPTSTVNILALMFFEALGSCILVFGWNFIGPQPNAPPLAIPHGQVGMALFVAATLCGGFSGGHFNPAVTLAIYIRDFRKTNKREGQGKAAGIMLLAQFIGGYFGVLLVYLVNSEVIDYNTYMPNIYPGKYYGYGQLFLVELVCSFLFYSVILRVKDGQFTEDGLLGAFVIGSALFVNIQISGTLGGVSGAALNPMVVTCQNTFVQGIRGPVTQEGAIYVKYLWDFWLADLLAGVFAALFFNIEASKRNKQVTTDEGHQFLE